MQIILNLLFGVTNGVQVFPLADSHVRCHMGMFDLIMSGSDS